MILFFYPSFICLIRDFHGVSELKFLVITFHTSVGARTYRLDVIDFPTVVMKMFLANVHALLCSAYIPFGNFDPGNEGEEEGRR